MSYFEKTKTIIDDSPNLDAFGRLRVSEPRPIFSSQLEYFERTWSITNWQPWETVISGSGNTATNQNSASLSLNVTTAQGDKVVRQQHVYNRYQPGISQIVEVTGALVVKTGVRSRIGYFDDEDGLFFEHDGSNLKVVLRNSSSGSVVETEVTQDNWNIDPLDGSGISNLILDISKIQIFVIDFQWLGAGSIRFGFNIQGRLHYFHEINNANIISDSPYMRAANLPVRYEIENTSNTASNSSMLQICSSVYAEGALADETGDIISVCNQSTPVTINDSDFRPILNIRPKLLYKGRKNTAQSLPISIDITSIESSIILWKVFLNPTFTGGSHSWQDVSDDSLLQFDSNRTGPSVSVSGRAINSGYLTGGPSGGFFGGGTGEIMTQSLDRNIILTTNYDFTESDILTVAGIVIDDTGTAEVLTSVVFREFK